MNNPKYITIPNPNYKEPEMVKCPCGSGHEVPRLAIVDRCPLLFAKALAESCHPIVKRKTEGHD